MRARQQTEIATPNALDFRFAKDLQAVPDAWSCTAAEANPASADPCFDAHMSGVPRLLADRVAQRGAGKARTRVLLILYVCNDETCEEW
jgi:hypothetical protein